MTVECVFGLLVVDLLEVYRTCYCYGIVLTYDRQSSVPECELQAAEDQSKVAGYGPAADARAYT